MDYLAFISSLLLSIVNNLWLRIWFIVVISLGVGAAIVRLAWEYTTITTASSFTLVTLVILTALIAEAMVICIALKPSLKIVTSSLARIWVTVILTAGITGSIIHFINFVPSPEATPPLSQIIASLLLLSGIIAYALVMWVIWFLFRRVLNSGQFVSK